MSNINTSEEARRNRLASMTDSQPAAGPAPPARPGHSRAAHSSGRLASSASTGSGRIPISPVASSTRTRWNASLAA